MNSLCETWGIDKSQVLDTASRFFNEYKRLDKVTEKQELKILNLQIKYVLSDTEGTNLYYVQSDQDNPKLYFSYLPQYADKIKAKGKGVIFFGKSFVFGLIGDSKNGTLCDSLEALCKTMSVKAKTVKKNSVKFDFKIKGQKPVETKDILQFSITGENFDSGKVVQILKDNKA
jgi:hypothetical protein